MKKLLSVFLALVMVFALCGGVLADDTTVTEETHYRGPGRRYRDRDPGGGARRGTHGGAR